jgi:hypothetical protein
VPRLLRRPLHGHTGVVAWEESKWAAIEPSRGSSIVLIAIACWAAAAVFVAGSAAVTLFPDCAGDTCVSPAASLREPASWYGPGLEGSIRVRLGVGMAMLILSAALVVIPIGAIFHRRSIFYVASGLAAVAVVGVLARLWQLDAPPHYPVLLPKTPPTAVRRGGSPPTTAVRPIGLPPPTTFRVRSAG